MHKEVDQSSLDPCLGSPIIGYYKLNVDASFKAFEHKAWVGIVLLCFRGEVVIYSRMCYTGITTVLQAELMAILFGIEMVKQ